MTKSIVTGNKTLKESTGGQSEGIDFMYGINEHGTIITRAVQKRLYPSDPRIDLRDWVEDVEHGSTEPML